MDKIVVDDSRFPLLRVTFPARRLTDEELAEYLAASAASIKTRVRKFAIVVDVGERPALTPLQRRMQADFMVQVAPVMNKLCVGQAYVMTSMATRGVLTALFWMAPPAFPWRICARREDAERWARDQLELAAGAPR